MPQAKLSNGQSEKRKVAKKIAPIAKKVAPVVRKIAGGSAGGPKTTGKANGIKSSRG